MIFLENLKRIAEKATGWRRPDDPQSLLRERKPQTYRFTDDDVIPNHPRWPLIIYKSSVRPPPLLDPAAVFEELFDSRGWRRSWRDGYKYVHYHSRIHEDLGIARGGNRVRFGGTNGRILTLKAGDVAILPAGTGHQCLEASKDLLVVGAYPASGVYDECRSEDDREKALREIDRAARPRHDPVYGRDGPLMHIWLPRNRRRSRQNKQLRFPCRRVTQQKFPPVSSASLAATEDSASEAP
jgi:uncharacterized protein YjlB